MSMRRWIRWLGPLGACMACSDTPAVNPLAKAPDLPTPNPAVALLLVADRGYPLPGRARVVTVEGVDAKGEITIIPTPTFAVQGEAEVTKVSSEIVPLPSGVRATRYTVIVTPRVVGRVTLRANTPTLADSARLDAVAPPRWQEALAIDSAYIAEYPACFGSCPGWWYSPLVWLRETSGVTATTVTAVEFRIAARSTGTCDSEVMYSPQQNGYLLSPHLSAFTAGLFIADTNASGLRADSATWRMHLRVFGGDSGWVERGIPVRRLAASVFLPSTPSAPVWDCHP